MNDLNFANILEHFLSEAKKVLEDMRNSVGHFLSCDDSPDQSVRRGRRPLQKLRDCVWPNNSDMDRFAEFINVQVNVVYKIQWLKSMAAGTVKPTNATCWLTRWEPEKKLQQVWPNKQSKSDLN